ncbi:MAG: acyl carrier protein [Deltaproteobacteria bacterium]|nr:acyl carrier protein [Deltaproteobacteria bacterium]
MDRETAFETVRRYLTKQFELPPEKVTSGAHLFEELELDSIDALDMISLMETELGMTVVEDELKTIRTVEDVVQYLVRHAPEKK